jgi:hypothetical protein
VKLEGYAVATALLALAACSASHDEARDRHRVAYAIDAIRDVPPEDVEDRIKLANNLAALDVRTPLAVRARDECAKAYRSLADSTRLTAIASSGLDPKSSADPKATLAAARDAIAAQDASEAAMSSCADASAAIRARP